VTIQEITARISSVVASAPFDYLLAREPFSFDLQPDQKLDQHFHVTVENEGSDGYLAFAQAELDVIRIFVCQKVRRDAHGAYAQVVTDVNSLVPAVIRNCVGEDYNAELRGWRVPDPPHDAAFIVGLVEFVVDYDRQL
jgi:hypothetical protein